MKYKSFVLMCCLLFLLCYSVFTLASEKYQCSGRFNTASDYLQIYVVSERTKSGYLLWNGTRFDVQENPVWIYAEYIGDTRTDVVYIEKETLDVMFYSILDGLMLHAKGKCKKIPPKLLEFRKKYIELDVPVSP